MNERASDSSLQASDLEPPSKKEANEAVETFRLVAELIQWVDDDKFFRAVSFKYRGPVRDVPGGWTGGWRVKLTNKRRSRRLRGYVGQELLQALEQAVKRIRK